MRVCCVSMSTTRTYFVFTIQYKYEREKTRLINVHDARILGVVRITAHAEIVPDLKGKESKQSISPDL